MLTHTYSNTHVLTYIYTHAHTQYSNTHVLTYIYTHAHTHAFSTPT